MHPHITYILADDDEMYRDFTLSQLQKIDGLTCIQVCGDAMATRAALSQTAPDLLLLDVEMPAINGIQLAKSLKKVPFIIFITSHSRYAADAFEVDAVDYLVKPVAIERMLRAIDKVKSLVALKTAASEQDTFQQNDVDSFFLKEKNTFVKITYQSIIYAESLGDFVNFILEDGTKRIALVNMKNLEQQLPATLFLRISRTHIINKQKIKSIKPEMVQVALFQLPIGTTYSRGVMQQIVGDKAIKRFK